MDLWKSYKETLRVRFIIMQTEAKCCKTEEAMNMQIMYMT